MNTREDQIEQARRLIATGISGDLKEVLEKQYPELKESKDERIRQGLLFFIKKEREKKHLTWDKIPLDDYEAYLEKQKEQTENEREYVRTLKSLISDFLRGKQEGDTGYYQKIYDWLDGRHLEQKPAELGGEEKKHLYNAIEAVKYVYDVSEGSGAQCIEFLKSLPERLNIQPKQEWIENDKTNGWTGVDLDRYLSCLQHLGTGNPQQPETINSKWFKKHCRPQLHWKPSEEQMKALLSKLPVVKGGGDKVQDILESLYNDLKKL